MDRPSRTPHLATWSLLVAMSLLLTGCVSITLVSDRSAEPSAPPDPASPSAGSPQPTPYPAATGSAVAPDVTSTGASPLGSATPITLAPVLPTLGPGQRRIGYLSLDEATAFVAAVSDSIRSSVQGAGHQLVECDAGWTRQGVLDCADRLGASGIDGLLSFQPFADLAPRVCEAVDGAPVVGIVFDQGACQVSRLRIDQEESGRLAGAAVGRFAKEHWDCATSAYLSLESSDADPDGRARMAGYRAGYEEHCPLPERTFQLDGADRLATAQAQVARRLATLQGRHVVVVGLNEDAIRGAMEAAADAGRAAEVWYSGQLADAPMRERIACDEQYIASVAQFPERFGEQLVPLLMASMAGREVPAVVDAPLELVTADNVRRLFSDTPACPG